MYLQFLFSKCNFHRNCAKQCGIFPTLTSLNTVRGPERFLSLMLPASGNLATNRNTGDIWWHL